MEEEKRFGRPERREKMPEEEISTSKAIDLLSEGNIAKEDKDFEKAIKHYQKAFNIYEKLAEQCKKEPKVVAGFKETRDKIKETKKLWAENLYGSGEKFLRERNHEEAVKYFQEAVKKNPKLIEGWVKGGTLLTFLGKYEEAHPLLKEGLRENLESKERWKIWSGLGKLFLQIGEFPRAVNCFLEALDLSKESFEIDYNLGLAFLNLRIGDRAVNTLKAMKYLEEAEKKNPKDSEISDAKGIAFFNFAEMGKSKEIAEEIISTYENALKAWNEAIEKNPDNHWAWFNKGLVLPILQKGKPKDWLKEANRSFDEVFRILTSKGEEKTAFTADVWYQKALIWRYWSEFNPHREKGSRNRDLKKCSKCLDLSSEIIRSLKIMPSEEFQKLYIEVKEELKKIEEWAKFGGAKKVKPIQDFNPMYA